MSKIPRRELKRMLVRYAYDFGYRDCPLCNKRMWFQGYEPKSFVTILSGATRQELDTRLVTLEHIKPTSQGGQNILKNLTLTCMCCNNNRDPVKTSHLLKPLLERARDYRLLYPTDIIRRKK